MAICPHVALHVARLQTDTFSSTGRPAVALAIHCGRRHDLWLLLMLVFYLIHIFSNNRLARNERVVWAIILPLFNMFIMPVYWYIYIWREKASTAA